MRADLVKPISWIIAALLWTIVLLAVRATWHWGIVNDAPLMLYIAKALNGGATPYRDIFDMNMPGAYLVCLAFVKLFGVSDLWWRVFDLAIQGLISAFVFLILKELDRPLAAIAAAGIALHHICLGPYLVGQRDYIMVLPQIASMYFLFRARKATSPPAVAALLIAAGASIASATLIKPPMILMYGVAVGFIVAAEGVSLAAVRQVIWVTIGAVAIGVAAIAWMAASGGLQSFIEVQLRFVAVSYAPIAMPVRSWIGTPLTVTAVVGLLVAIGSRYRHEYLAVLATVLISLFSYHAQRRYWVYQLAPVFVFAPMATFFALALFQRLLVQRRWVMAAGAVTIGVQVALLGWAWNKLRTDLGPQSAVMAPTQDEAVVATLAQDLQNVNDLSRGVQPLDTVVGVVNTMLRLNLKMPTRALYAFPLYLEGRTEYMDQERARFLQDLQKNEYPPIVRTNQQWPYKDGFDRLERWPAFSEMIEQHYRVAVERNFDGGGAYRVYVRR